MEKEIKETIGEENKKTKDKKMRILTIISILLAIILVVVSIFLILNLNKTYTITFDSNGGEMIEPITIKNNEIVNLPEPKKAGYVFGGWVTQDNELAVTGAKINEDLDLKAKWIDEKKDIYTVIFETDGGTKFGTFQYAGGKIDVLPMDPDKEGYVFNCWVDESGHVVKLGYNITSDMTIRAIWIKKKTETINIKFDTDGGNKLDDIQIEKGTSIVFPIDPVKEGYKFKGWMNQEGQIIDQNTIFDTDTTLKAKWVVPYTCPADCTPMEDGSKCQKVSTTNIVTETKPASNATKVTNSETGNSAYVDLSTKYHANRLDSAPWWGCNSSNDFMWSESDGWGGAFMWCAKKTNMAVYNTCPEGYSIEGKICKKTETINCTEN